MTSQAKITAIFEILYIYILWEQMDTLIAVCGKLAEYTETTFM